MLSLAINRDDTWKRHRKARIMLPHRPVGSPRKAAFALTALIPFVVCGAAYATDCNQDIGALTKKRQGIIDQLNQLAQGGKKQLDPVASCPRLRALVAV
ncbi:MAG TPA: hypothetical protein VHT02_07280, partial [Methylocella sp.]|nr:hypothetical protein [Methylocella sp.]